MDTLAGAHRSLVELLALTQYLPRAADMTMADHITAVRNKRTVFGQVTGLIGRMRLIAPMLATAGTLPDNTDRPWSFEMKYDGCRMLASVGGCEPVLWTRAMNVVTPQIPRSPKL